MIAINNSLTRAAVLLAAFAGHVSAYGSAVVHNQCDFDVYLWAVSEQSGSMQTLPANGGQWSQEYQSNPDGGGLSIKMASETSGSNITQFEYTLTGATLWYDLSNINGYPFAPWGVSVTPADKQCRGVICPAGTALCGGVYNVPSDNFATAACGSDADAVVVLCSGETDTSGSSSISSVVSSVASVVSSFTAASPTTTEALPKTTSAEAAPTTHTFVKPTESGWKPTHHWSHPPPQNTNVHVASVTAAPPPPAHVVPHNPFVVVETTFVTHVVTVEARSPQPTAEVKREAHAHEHGAVHKEHVAPHHVHAHARNFRR